MRRILFAVLSAAVLFGAETPEQRGKRVVDECVQALGGDRYLNMETRVETGRAYSFYREQLSGLSVAKIYTRYTTVAAGKSGDDLGVRERQAFGKNEDSAVIFREDGAWEVNWRGSKEIEKERFERYRDSTLRSVFYILRQRLNEPGIVFDWHGSDVWENQPVNIVDITDSQDRVVTVYFHQSTKLPVRQLFSWRDAKTHERTDEETRFARYRDVAGVQWPLQITRERNGEKVYQMFADLVQMNQELTDNLFSPEAGVKRK